MQIGRPQLQTLILYGAIPLVALLVLGRQVYLSKLDTLSIWKGGGMGMFAGVDSAETRYFRIWMGPPGEEKHPVMGLTYHQKLIRQKALWYPSRDRLQPLARSLQKSKFVAQRARTPVHRSNERMDKRTPTGRSLLLLTATGPRDEADRLGWEVSVHYWKIRYDPEARRAQKTLVTTYEFPAGLP